MSEHKTLKDAPLNTPIEIKAIHATNKWFDCKVACKANNTAIVAELDGKEWAEYLTAEWRYPIDPIEELENKLLELWCSQDVAYAWDEWKDIPHRWLLQTMIDAGADVERIK